MGLFDEWEAQRAAAPAATEAKPSVTPWHALSGQPASGVPLIKPIDTTGTPEEREAFVVAMLKNSREPHKLAIELFGSGRWQFASIVAVQWPSADWFLARKRELIEEHGEEAFLPSKAQIARELYNGAHDAIYDAEVSLKFYKLYCDIMEYVKPGAGATVNVQNNTQNVMLVPTHNSDKDWEDDVAAQQAKLVKMA